jgi:predicted TPR repeat methyltransferase
MLVGVDLSAAMLEKARARGGYDALHTEGLLDFLARTDERFDVVVAADVFVYVGALDDVFAGVRACCDGRFVFTTELCDAGMELRPSGRYAHGQDRIDELAARHGFVLVHRSVEPLRTEAQQPVLGQLVVLAVPQGG